MNEIDLVRRFRAESNAQANDDERESSARRLLMEAVNGERASRGTSRRWVRPIAIVVGILLLPAGYAIADSTGVFGDDDVVVLTPQTAEPVPAPAAVSESNETRKSADREIVLTPETARPAAAPASESKKATRDQHRGGVVKLTPDEAISAPQP